jgi:hypothetical protein
MNLDKSNTSIPVGTDKIVINRQDIAEYTCTLDKILVPYKSYVAVLSQSGGNAPEAIILNNDFTGVTFTWSYVGIGSYLCTTSSPVLTGSKTFVFFQHRDGNETYPIVTWNSNQVSTTVINLKNNVIASTSNIIPSMITELPVSPYVKIEPKNSCMTYAPIEIRVYN